MGRGKRGRARAARQEAKYARKAARGLFKKLGADVKFRKPKPRPKTPQAPTPPKPDPIRRVSQQQQGHIFGTPQYKRRLADGKPTSYFHDERSANKYTYEAWYKGKPVKGDPRKREHDFGHPVGVGPKGGTQSRVRVHMDNKGEVHGHPSGPETAS
ncbi:MAG TPA: hypothetical protein VLJ59_19315 [Mycobacteriales bacterium]|nr:hypothetical protein [Mycobacteriales bacterium]